MGPVPPWPRGSRRLSPKKHWELLQLIIQHVTELERKIDKYGGPESIDKFDRRWMRRLQVMDERLQDVESKVMVLEAIVRNRPMPPAVNE